MYELKGLYQRLDKIVGFLLTVITLSNARINYCEHVKSCANIPNIVCQRKEHCSARYNCWEVQLKKSTKTFILIMLNEYRNDVALGLIKDFPSSSDMLAQYWDEDLEYVTICTQNTCEKIYDLCANTVKFDHTVQLQNILPIDSVKGEVDFFEKTIKKWMDPGHFTRDQIDAFTDPLSSYYATILWDTSPAIGCALSYDLHFYYGACTFSIAPREGEQVYRIGEPCSGCPRGLECNKVYPGLCGEIMLPRSNGRVRYLDALVVILVGLLYRLFDHLKEHRASTIFM